MIPLDRFLHPDSHRLSGLTNRGRQGLPAPRTRRGRHRLAPVGGMFHVGKMSVPSRGTITYPTQRERKNSLGGLVPTHLKNVSRQIGFIFPKLDVENKKSLSCHHLENHRLKRAGWEKDMLYYPP